LHIGYDYSLLKNIIVCYFSTNYSYIVNNYILYYGSEECDNEFVATNRLGYCQVSEVSQYTRSTISLFIDDCLSLGLTDSLFLFVAVFRNICRIKHLTFRELPMYSSYWSLDLVCLIHV
jgi:hypothetical protein